MYRIPLIFMKKNQKMEEGTGEPLAGEEWGTGEHIGPLPWWGRGKGDRALGTWQRGCRLLQVPEKEVDVRVSHRKLVGQGKGNKDAMSPSCVQCARPTDAT